MMTRWAKRLEEAENGMQSREGTIDVAGVQDWLMARVADLTGLDVEEISVSEPFATYGLSSVAAVSLTGELEDWLGRELSPTLAWEYPNIRELALHLAQGEVEGN